MMRMKLTQFPLAVTSRKRERMGEMVPRAGVISAGVAMLLTGCINVAAPDEPIVIELNIIELNINIRQEVIYRLADDAANTIDENADIF